MPWEKERTSSDSTDEIEEEEVGQSGDETESGVSKDSDRNSKKAVQEATEKTRKPGKQPGAEGFGRQQSLAVTGQEEHYPEYCACCGRALNADGKKAWTAFETLDLEWADETQPGLPLTNTRHS